MAVRTTRSFLLTALLLALVTSFADSESDSDLIRELVSLRSAADSGVIRLDDDGVSRFISSVATPRPYSLLIFFDAVDLHSTSELHLQELRREFGIVSASFTANNNGSDGTKIFFCDIDATESEASFHRFAVESLPHIRLVEPWMENLQDESGKMEHGDYDGSAAKSMAEFVERRTKLTVGPIHRPPLLSKTQVTIIAALIVISAPILIKKVLKGGTILHDRRVWLSGAVFVYFFSVAGTMNNIINSAPMFLRDYEDSGKLVLFYEGSDYQLWAEGLAVGFLYTVVGLLLAYVTNALVRVRNLNEQRLIMVLALFISFWSVKKVVYLDNWKTGYEIHPYWPSSWH